MNTTLDTRIRHLLQSLQRNYLSFRLMAWQQFAPNLTQNAFNKLLRQHIELDYLLSHDVQLIPEAKSYLTIGPRGCRLLGISPRLAREIPEQLLPGDVSMFAYTSMRRPYRKRLTSEELGRRYPFVDARLHRSPWLIEHFDKQPVLTMVRAEYCGSLETVTRKVCEQLKSFRGNPEFSRLIERGHFMYVLVAATQQKAKAFEVAFRELGEFVTPRQFKLFPKGSPGMVRIKPVFYPPLLRFAG